MKLSSSPLRGRQAGMTLIELTVIISVLLLLLTVTFVGVSAWKRGGDRAQCLANIRQVQQAVRGYSNLHSLKPGDDAKKVSNVKLEDELIKSGKYVSPPPRCPGNGKYDLGGNKIPPIGRLYMTCSLADSEGHVPNNYAGW